MKLMQLTCQGSSDAFAILISATWTKKNTKSIAVPQISSNTGKQ